MQMVDFLYQGMWDSENETVSYRGKIFLNSVIFNLGKNIIHIRNIFDCNSVNNKLPNERT